MTFFLLFFSLLIGYSGDIFVNDSNKVKELKGKFLAEVNNNPEASRKYLDSIKTLVKKHSEIYPGFFKLKGIYFYRKGSYDSSLRYYYKALETYNRSNDSLEKAKVLINVSMVYNRLSEYESTIEMAVNALKIFEALNDLKGISISNNIIGQVYFFLDDYNNALLYFRNYLNNALKSADSNEIGSGYNNIGAIFSEIGNADSALFYNFKAAEIAEMTGNNFSLANAYQNIATSLKQKQKTKKSISYYEKAVDIYQKLNDLNGLAEVNFNLGVLFKQSGNQQQAEDKLQKALIQAEAIKNQYLIKSILLELSLLSSSLNNYKDAFEYYIKYDSIADALLSAENRKNIEEIETRYETAKKDSQIAFQRTSLKEKELLLHRNTYLIAGLLIILIMLVILFVFWRNRVKMKQEAALREQMIKMKQEQIEAVLYSQENERKRFASDLHDGMGQLITALNLNIQSMRQLISDTEEGDELSINSLKILGEIHDEIRNIANNLIPKVLLRDGLISALKILIRRINKSGKINIKLNVFQFEKRFQQNAEVSIYRIIQEFLSNILKYSGAEKVMIQFTSHDEEILISIEDDGMGYDLHKFRNSEGYGWRNIKTRIDILKADLEIDTVNGRKNNTIFISIPKSINQK